LDAGGLSGAVGCGGAIGRSPPVLTDELAAAGAAATRASGAAAAEDVVAGCGARATVVAAEAGDNAVAGGDDAAICGVDTLLLYRVALLASVATVPLALSDRPA